VATHSLDPKLMSTAGAECVSAPTDTHRRRCREPEPIERDAAGNHLARPRAPAALRASAGKRHRRADVRSTCCPQGRCRPPLIASSTSASVCASTSIVDGTLRPGARDRCGDATGEPDVIVLIRIASNRPMRWLHAAGAHRAFLQCAQVRVLRVSRIVMRPDASTNRRVIVAMPESRWRLSASASAQQRARACQTSRRARAPVAVAL
jgi:hypothetical protein